MDYKTELRIRAKDIRKNLNIQNLSKIFTEKVRALDVYKNAKNILIYYPTGSEISLLDLLEDDKNFYFPRVKARDLLVCPYDKGVNFEKSKFNILEPCSNPVNSDILDLIIVPALMVDKNGYRLGYGGGFYDRFLGNLKKKIQTLCVVPRELFVENLPHEQFDIPVDLIVCEK